MANFPLLKLPLLASLDVLKEWNFFDLLNFSQLSKRSLRLCKMAQYKVKSLTWIFCPEFAMIYITVPGNAYMFTIFTDAEENEDAEPGDEMRVFEGHEFIRRNYEWIFNVVNPLTAAADAEKVFYTLSNRILEIVRCEEMNATFEAAFTPELPLWNIRREFSNVLLDCSSPLTVEATQFMFANLKIDNLHVVDGIPANFMISEALPFKKLETESAEWIQSGAFLAMKCETVEICSRPLSFHLINLIVKNWISGNLPNLKLIKMPATHADRTRILLECTEGVEIAPYDFRVRPKKKTITGTEYNLYRGVDFKRTDGKIATIDILPDDLFLFVAW